MITFGELKGIIHAYDAQLGDDAEVVIRGGGPAVHGIHSEDTTIWCGERDGLRTTGRLVITGEGKAGRT